MVQRKHGNYCAAALSELRNHCYRVLVSAERVRLRREDGQVPIQDDVGQRVDKRLVVDDEEHLGTRSDG